MESQRSLLRRLDDLVRSVLGRRAFQARIAAETPRLWHAPGFEPAYVHVPKVATRSIRTALTRAARPETRELSPDALGRAADALSSHRPWAEIRSLDAFRFSFVRDPFDRLYSCYRDKVLGPASDPNRANPFRAYGIRPGIPFERFVRHVVEIPDDRADRHFRSQSWFLFEGGASIVDFVGRFERLDADWAELRRRFGLPELPHHNRSEAPGAFQEAYSGELARLVARRYARDLEAFDYREPGAAARA